MASFILTAAIRAVKSRMGTWRAYDSVRTVVPEITRDEWARAIGEARSAIAQRVLEATRPLNRVPIAGEWTPITRKSGANWWQQVEVYIRDSTTGARSVWNVTIKTDTLHSRAHAMAVAEQQAALVFSSDPDNYPVAIVGVGYSGTYQVQRPQ